MSASTRPVQYRPRRSQGRPLHKLRDLKPIPLDRYRFTWWREAAKFILSVAAVIAAVLIWTVRPWS